MDLNINDVSASKSWSPMSRGIQVYTQRFSDGQDVWGYYSNPNIFTPSANDS